MGKSNLLKADSIRLELNANVTSVHELLSCRNGELPNLVDTPPHPHYYFLVDSLHYGLRNELVCGDTWKLQVSREM